jgi:hypothetical protein
MSSHLRLNRTQKLVLTFLWWWAVLVVILVAAPGIYNRALRLPGGEPALPVLGFLAATSTFLVVLVIFPRSACHRGR